MHHVWVRISFLCLSAVLFHKGIISPHRPPTNKSTMYKGEDTEYVVQYIASYGDVSTSLRYLAAFSYVYHLRSQTCRNYRACGPGVTYTYNIYPQNYLPVARTCRWPRVVIAGGAIHMWCYRALGRFFVLEVVVGQTHTLVTNGPYAYVRHTPYIAMFVLL